MAGGGPAYNPSARLSNYTYIQTNEPTDPIEGETWFNPNNNEFKQYDGEQWRFYPLTGSGFTMGGYNELQYLSIVDRFDFPFDFGHAANIGSLTLPRWRSAGANSSTHGYCIGGNAGVNYISTVDRFEFPFGTANKIASLDPKRLTGEKAVIEATKEENLTDTGGNLSVATTAAASCNSSTNAYIMGGETIETVIIDNVKRFSFPFDTSVSTDAGKLSIEKKSNTGWNNSTHGYSVGGYSNFIPVDSALIEKFQFASNVGQAIFAGNLSSSKSFMSSCNSSTYGYTFGSYKSNEGSTNQIDKFEFSVFGQDSVLAGQLDGSRYGAAGVNSTKKGYVVGGTVTGFDVIGSCELIDFPFDSGFSRAAGVLSNRRRHLTATDNTDFINMFV